MGRYYFGDIEGKFAFAIQSSDAADRFGVSGEPPAILRYYFDSDNLYDVEEELKNILKNFGDRFFDIRKAYHGFLSYEEKEELKIGDSELSEFYDFKLGLKIRRCIKLTGRCEFEAEI
ncbi:MAG: hypothetical protein KGQ36_07060 [Rickettsiales bacterium]|nr:hypothetical protein [Rickettsiales bacterium]